MNEQPLVSIVTPMFNSEEYIEQTIESVLKQQYHNWELIVVDDGSSDNSWDIVYKLSQQDSRIKLYKRDRNPKGRSTSRNIGIEKSAGKYLLFLDSDDLLFPQCLKNRVEIMERKPELHFSVFQMEMFSPLGGTKNELSTLDVPNYLQAFLSYQHPWNITCPFWNNQFFKEKLIGFNESYSILEDPELHTRALLLDKIQFDVFHQKEYTDCAYRVDYKPTNTKVQLKGVSAYMKQFLPQIKGRANEKECRESFLKYYETVLAHYSGQTDKVIFENISIVKQINLTFFNEKIIDKKMFKKTNCFLNMHKYKMFKKTIIVALLKKIGFTNFYFYTIGRKN